jgi:hypothetical protein
LANQPNNPKPAPKPAPTPTPPNPKTDARPQKEQKDIGEYRKKAK